MFYTTSIKTPTNKLGYEQLAHVFYMRQISFHGISPDIADHAKP